LSHTSTRTRTPLLIALNAHHIPRRRRRLDIAQDALVAALRAGEIAGAGLDVATPAPLPPDSPLWDAPNVVVTGHTAGHTPLYWDRGIELLVDNLRRFLAGEPLLNTVDTGAGY